MCELIWSILDLVLIYLVVSRLNTSRVGDPNPWAALSYKEKIT